MRTDGAKSYANVAVGDLAGVFSGATVIPVSRVWLRKMNVELDEKTITLKSHPAPSEPATEPKDGDAALLNEACKESDVSEHA